MNRSIIVGMAALVLAVSLASVITRQSSERVIRVADPRAIGWAPFAVAIENGFFVDEGLAVEVIGVQTGDEALKALAGRSADVALAGTIPYSFIAFDSPSLKVIAQTAYVHDNQIIARRSSGIARPADVRGKRIGYAKTTASDIGVKMFLQNHGLSAEDVTLVPLKPLAMPEALAGKHIDAYSAWNPPVYNGQKLLGEDAIVFDDVASTYTWHAAIVSNERFVHGHQDELVRFVRAWVRAEAFMHEHPNEARAIIARSTKIPEDVLAVIEPKYEFGIGLPEDLLQTLATDLAWANGERAVPRTAVPVPETLIDRSVWEVYEKNANTR